MKIFRTVLLVSIAMKSPVLHAQKYSTAAGIRVGSGIGITVQQAVFKNYTVEGILQKGFFNDLTTLSFLLEQHNGILGKSTNFYVGAGPQIGMYGNSTKTANLSNSFGVGFIGGLEFKLGKTLLSVDFKPAINISGGSSFFESSTGLSLRYVFVKAKPKEHSWMFWKKKKSTNKANK